MVTPYRLDQLGKYQLTRITPFVEGEKVAVGVFEGFGVDFGVLYGS